MEQACGQDGQCCKWLAKRVINSTVSYITIIFLYFFRRWHCFVETRRTCHLCGKYPSKKRLQTDFGGGQFLTDYRCWRYRYRYNTHKTLLQISWYFWSVFWDEFCLKICTKSTTSLTLFNNALLPFVLGIFCKIQVNWHDVFKYAQSRYNGICVHSPVSNVVMFNWWIHQRHVHKTWTAIWGTIQQRVHKLLLWKYQNFIPPGKIIPIHHCFQNRAKVGMDGMFDKGRHPTGKGRLLWSNFCSYQQAAFMN